MRLPQDGDTGFSAHYAGTVTDDRPPPRTDHRLLVRAAVCGVLIVFLTAGTTVAAALLQVRDVVDIVKHGEPAIPHVSSVLDTVAADKPQTLLLLGSDHRYGTGANAANSDTILLVRLNPDAPATTVLSIPRDLQVDIPGYGVNKINAAFGLGGPVLTARTVRQLLHIKINHVFVTTFTAFSRAVDFIGCVYTDVDHRYYVPPNAGYSKIDLQPGYQRLCGTQALSFVRFRHADNDIVRNARQQAFLRAAAQQVRVSGLITRAKKLVRLLADYTQTDVRSSTAVLRLLKLGVLSAGHPVTQVPFPAILPSSPTDPYVHVDPGPLDAAVGRFMNPTVRHPPSSASQPAGGGSGSGSAKHAHAAPLTPAPDPRGAAQTLSGQAGFRVPRLTRLIPGSSPASSGATRAYTIRDPAGGRHRAYRYVFALGDVGQYYGLQGMTWSDPPILHEATGTLRIRGRTAEYATSGGHILWIAWRRNGRVDWLANTLTHALSNRQMLALARAVRW
jgi:LCP family protein required for cell wall assembly